MYIKIYNIGEKRKIKKLKKNIKSWPHLLTVFGPSDRTIHHLFIPALDTIRQRHLQDVQESVDILQDNLQ